MTRKIIRIEASYPKLLHIYFDLGNICNYKCWYCFPGSNEGTVPWPDSDKVKKGVVSLVNYYLSTGKVNDIELNLMGGEPTLWPKLDEVVKYIAENCKCKVQILTNGSRTLRWWKENAKYFDYIGISVHHEKCDIDHIIELGNFLYDSGIKFHTSVLMDPDNWDKCMDLVNKLNATEKKWVVITKTVHEKGVTRYNEEQTSFLEKQIKRWPAIKYWFKYLLMKRRKYKAFFSDGSVIKTKTDNYFLLNLHNRFYGWECTLGINYLFIDRQGKLTGGCQQKLYGLDYYYNIYDDDFAENFKPEIKTVTCEQKACVCAGETALTKWKKD